MGNFNLKLDEVPPGGFEPPSPPYERGARCQLRYGDFERCIRIELTFPAWQAGALTIVLTPQKREL